MTYYKHPGFSGVALTLIGPQTKPGQTEWWDDDAQEWVTDEEPEPVETGLVLTHIINDNASCAVDPGDLIAIPDEDEVCSCGQLECGWG